MRMHNPPHPGQVLRDALKALPITVAQFAAHISVARSTVNRVLSGKAGITPDMSIRLSEAFGQSQPDLWLNMQTAYDFWQVSRARRKRVKPLKTAA